MDILKEAGEWLYSLVVSFALALFLAIFIFQPTIVSGQSMEPTLDNGNYVVLSKLSHTFSRLPNYGDVVVVDSRVARTRTLSDDLIEPVMNIVYRLQGRAPEHIWVKRLIGLPGDVIEFKDDKVLRNGIPLVEPYIKEPMHYTAKQATIVPPNQVYVLGDNRNNSGDSRYIGPVPGDHVLGVMLFKL